MRQFFQLLRVKELPSAAVMPFLLNDETNVSIHQGIHFYLDTQKVSTSFDAQVQQW
jgi:hypothetical protein